MSNHFLHFCRKKFVAPEEVQKPGGITLCTSNLVYPQGSLFRATPTQHVPGEGAWDWMKQQLTVTTNILAAGLPLTLAHNGYPVVDIPVQPGQDRIDVWLAPIHRAVSNNIARLKVRLLSSTVFSPIYVMPDYRQPRSHIPTENSLFYKLGLPMDQGLANAHRLADVAHGAGEDAMQAIEPRRRRWGLEEAVKTAIDAVRWDPNNLSGYLAAARFSALLETAEYRKLALDFVLTLTYKLLVIERMLGTDWRDAEHRGRLFALLQAHLRPQFFELMSDVTAALGLEALIIAELRNVRRTAAGWPPWINAPPAIPKARLFPGGPYSTFNVSWNPPFFEA